MLFNNFGLFLIPSGLSQRYDLNSSDCFLGSDIFSLTMVLFEYLVLSGDNLYMLLFSDVTMVGIYFCFAFQFYLFLFMCTIHMNVGLSI